MVESARGKTIEGKSNENIAKVDKENLVQTLTQKYLFYVFCVRNFRTLLVNFIST